MIGTVNLMLKQTSIINEINCGLDILILTYLALKED